MESKAPSIKLTALRMLAQRRLTEAELHHRLAARGFAQEEILDVIGACKSEGYLDDVLYARLFIEGRVKSVGNARMVAELVRRGIDRERAQEVVGQTEHGEEERLESAVAKVFRTRPGLSYPSAARALERLGFPTQAIYRKLRARAEESRETLA